MSNFFMIVEQINESTDYGNVTFNFPKTEILIYRYWSGAYEGGGNAIFYCEGKWYHDQLDHCSCNDPFDDLYGMKPTDIIETMRHASTELFDQLKELVLVARKHGYFQEPIAFLE